MKETIKLKFNLYTTMDGRPTCRLSDEEQCPFLLCHTFGQKFVCGAGEQKSIDGYKRNMADFLEPRVDCFLRTWEK